MIGAPANQRTIPDRDSSLTPRVHCEPPMFSTRRMLLSQVRESRTDPSRCRFHPPEEGFQILLLMRMEVGIDLNEMEEFVSGSGYFCHTVEIRIDVDVVAYVVIEELSDQQ